MPQRLQDWVSVQAQRRPQAAAVVLGEQSLNYGELDAFSSRLANALAAHGCAPGDRVCLLMPKTPLAVAAIVGIYKAGCVFVPLDPASPPARLAAVVRSSGARLLLAAGPVVEAVRALPGPLAVAWLDPISAVAPAVAGCFHYRDVVACPPRAPTLRRGATAPAHILFTSGSTGEPKGVVITHDNVISFVEWAVEYFRIGPDERLSGHSPLAFDLSVFDIFGSFAAGAALHLVPPACSLVPGRLAAWIRDSALTQWFSVPSVFNYLAKFDAVGQGDFPTLRRVLWCGEVLPTPSLIYWMQRLPHARFTNLYGPTEATIASSHYTVEQCPADPTAPIPIGQPCGGEDLLVMGDDGRPTRSDVTGDLYIAGVGLSPGYWNDPAATRKAFRRDPATGERLYRTGDRARRGADGLVYFAGREDTQIKSRGYRIELGEIEAALATVARVREGAVVAVASGDFDGAAICCSYVPAADPPVTSAELRAELARLLPGYMIPSRWQALAVLPRNGTGKIDRKVLREEWQAAAAEEEVNHGRSNASG